jgi:hypothetical protein
VSVRVVRIATQEPGDEKQVAIPDNQWAARASGRAIASLASVLISVGLAGVLVSTGCLDQRCFQGILKGD